MMDKATMTKAILEAKAAKGLSWDSIASAVGMHPVFVCSACLGENSMDMASAKTLCTALDLGEEVATALTTYPYKGASQHKMIPTDPLVYRFYEIMLVYGGTLKEIIHEKFGDGIMSAIDYTMDVAKQEDPKGDRVVVTMNGKFLPYKKW
ncbi:MAG: cyanase [Candidatus Competibacteraceae bacterium]